jgi:3-oxoacyl-[acyl-carrier-protein] synthase III
MVGIEDIAVYLPKNKISNFELKEKFEIEDSFIEEKIGVRSVSRMSKAQNTSDIGVEAFYKLQAKTGFNVNNIECLIVVTQNPDYNLPHTSAIIHGKLDLPENCACFDISLGCSGYVYGLSVIKSFMEQNDLNKGILITADPYSKVVDSDDKNTSLLFGDGATATLISNNPVFSLGKFTYGTIGKEYETLICINGILSMNGRAIFNFAAKKIPKDIKLLLEKNKLSDVDIDYFIFHQGSKYIVDTISKRLGLEKSKVPFKMQEYGNTVSSSIPIVIADILEKQELKTIAISGFGVGLSWSSGILNRIK